MAFFSMFQRKKEEPDGPVFVKPFSDGSEDIRALSEKLAVAPPNSKYIFRDALESIRAKANRHACVASVLAECGKPALILYDVRIAGRAGSARIDFIVLAPGWIMTLNCPERAAETLPDESEELGLRAPYPGDFECEDQAYTLAEILRASGHLSAKTIRNVWPVRILTEEEERRDPNAGRNFSSAYSKMYPDIRSAQVIPCRELPGLIEALSGSDYAPIEYSFGKLEAMSDFLLDYDTKITDRPMPYREKKEETL